MKTVKQLEGGVTGALSSYKTQGDYTLSGIVYTTNNPDLRSKVETTQHSKRLRPLTNQIPPPLQLFAGPAALFRQRCG